MSQECPLCFSKRHSATVPWSDRETPVLFSRGRQLRLSTGSRLGLWMSEDRDSDRNEIYDWK